MGHCTSADDFVFSAGFIAGPEPSQSEMPTKQWYRNVKSKLRVLDGVAVELSVLSKNDLARSKKITADFYTQKHLFIDTLSEMQDDGRAVSGQVLELISSLEISEDQKAKLLAAMGAGPGFDISQRMAAHTTSTITNKVYKVGKEKRDNEFLKTLSLKL